MSGAKGYYSSITATVYTQLMNSPSKGKFLASEIRAKPKKYEWTAHSPEGGTVSSGVNTDSGMESSSLKTQLKKSLEHKAKIIPIHIQSRNFHQTMLKAKKRLD